MNAEMASAVVKNTMVGVTNARRPDLARSAIVSGLMEMTTNIRPVSAAAEVPTSR